MDETQTKNLFEAFKLLDKELIEKILAISKTIQVEELGDGVIRLSIDLMVKKD